MRATPVRLMPQPTAASHVIASPCTSHASTTVMAGYMKYSVICTQSQTVVKSQDHMAACMVMCRSAQLVSTIWR